MCLAFASNQLLVKLDILLMTTLNTVLPFAPVPRPPLDKQRHVDVLNHVHKAHLQTARQENAQDHATPQPNYLKTHRVKSVWAVVRQLPVSMLIHWQWHARIDVQAITSRWKWADSVWQHVHPLHLTTETMIFTSAYLTAQESSTNL